MDALFFIPDAFALVELAAASGHYRKASPDWRPWLSGIRRSKQARSILAADTSHRTLCSEGLQFSFVLALLGMIQRTRKPLKKYPVAFRI